LQLRVIALGAPEIDYDVRVLSAMEIGASHFQRWIRAGATAAGGLYVAGLILNAVYFTGYGVTALALLRAQNIMAGVWLVLPFGLVYLVSVSANVAIRVKRDIGKTTPPSAVRVGCALTVVLILFILGAPFFETFKWKSANLLLRILIAAIFVLVLILLGRLRIQAEEIWRDDGDTPYVRGTSALYKRALAAWLPVFALAYIGYFSRTVYPLIPASLGGGAPVPVLVVPKAPASFRTMVTLPIKEGVVYPMLAESDKAFVLVVNDRAVEIDRELISAVLIQESPELRRVVPRSVEEFFQDRKSETTR